jgi:aminoglycoside phosphotransferase (APT) family kinase protein
VPVPGLNEALSQVGRGPATRVVRLSGGHIHRTWSVHTAQGRVVAQQLNEHVFPDLQACEQNLRRIDDHLAGADGVSVPHLLRGVDGLCQVRDSAGATWRITEYAVGTRAGAAVRSAPAAARAAEAYGRYVAALANLPGPRLRATIARFHDLPWRIEQLDSAIYTDRVGRSSASRADIDRIRSLAVEVQSVVDRLPAQPVRSVHNDAKVGNLRFGAGGAPMVLDLDTTMPGAVIFDVGELLRTATHDRVEDAASGRAIEMDKERVAAVLEGFTYGMGDLLTDGERDAMRPAAPLMAIENAVRMLTDHLDGDRYYRVEAADQNLSRARVQVGIAQALIDTVG